MFDPHRPLTWCALLAFSMACDAGKPDQNTGTSTEATATRFDGPAYVSSLTSGILPLAADAHQPVSLALARHRPGRSDLWLQGRLLGTRPEPWKLDRNTLTVPLAGAMVHGLHELALITAQYPNFSKSAPVVIAITPAPPAKPQLTQVPDRPALDQGIGRILYPGQGTLFGAPLAWIYKNPKNREGQLGYLPEPEATPKRITLSGEVPDLSQALSLAIAINADATDLVAVFLDSPQTLWHWRVVEEQSVLTKIPIPAPKIGYQAGFYRVGADPSGFWVSAWESISPDPRQARPGDHRLFSLDPSEDRLHPVSASAFGQSALTVDLRLGGVVKSVSTAHTTTQLRVDMDSWNPKSGPPAVLPSTLYRWTDNHRATPVQRCGTLSPLLDEIWVGLDAQATLVAGAKSGEKYLSLPLKNPGAPGLALGPLPLDCSVHDGRFVAIRSHKDGSPLQILHFDGALMHEQTSDVSCEGAAFSESGGKSRLWCLRDGSLFPMTLTWQRPKANAEK